MLFHISKNIVFPPHYLFETCLKEFPETMMCIGKFQLNRYIQALVCYCLFYTIWVSITRISHFLTPSGYAHLYVLNIYILFVFKPYKNICTQETLPWYQYDLERYWLKCYTEYKNILLPWDTQQMSMFEWYYNYDTHI